MEIVHFSLVPDWLQFNPSGEKAEEKQVQRPKVEYWLVQTTETVKNATQTSHYGCSTLCNYRSACVFLGLNNYGS